MPLIWQQLFIPRSCRLPGAETPVCWGAAGSAVRYPGGPHLGWPRATGTASREEPRSPAVVSGVSPQRGSGVPSYFPGMLGC